MAAMLFASFITAASAATLSVGTPEGFETISAALAASVDGDRIEVAAGTYDEQIDLDGKAVTLISVSGPTETIVQSSSTPIVMLNNGEDAETVISGFMFRGGTQTCIYIEGGSPHIENIIVENCGAPIGVYGGALETSAASPTIRSAQFRNNRAHMGGSVYIGAGSNVTLDSCSFSGNQAQIGGAVAVTSAELSLINSDFDGNIAESGGAIATTNTALFLEDTRLTGNEGRFGIAGAVLSVDSDIAVNGSTFEDNHADYNGGAVLAERGSMTFNDSSFLNNIALFGSGGAVHLSDATSINTTWSVFEGNHSSSQGGGIAGSNISSADISNTTFVSNRVDVSGSGGAVFIEYSGLRITESSFANNSATNGGAIGVSSSDIEIESTLFRENLSTESGAALHTNRGSVGIDTSTFTDNQASGSAGAVYSSAIETTVANSVFIENSSSGGDGGALYLAGTDASVVDTSMLGNSAQRGGAIYGFRTAIDTDATLRVQSSIFQENTALFTTGGLDASGAVRVRAHNNTFVGNTSFTMGAVAHIKIHSPDADLRNNIIAFGEYGSGVSLGESAAATATFRYNNVFGNFIDYGGWTPLEDAGNFSIEPGFVDLSMDANYDNDDLTLRTDSPCIDAADPTFELSTGYVGALGVDPATTTAIDDDDDGYSPDTEEDCDDSDASIHIDADEICGDSVDNDCDSEIDEGCELIDTGDVSDSGDTGTIATDDTGVDVSEDTGGVAQDHQDTDADDFSGRTDTGVPLQSEAELYPLDGKGCSCSTTRGQPTRLLWFIVPLIMLLRRQT